ncbi:hypothetical protein KFU94_11270 [Chloroflexi bacterium TSY]|nr:hypothetical protein [Chloroflexi bacterium TSY]
MNRNHLWNRMNLFWLGILAILILAGCVMPEQGDAMHGGGETSENSSNDHMGMEPEILNSESGYDGSATEIAIRRLNEDQNVDEFAAARDAFVALLKEQPGVSSDREFAPFVDFLTFGPPEPPVFIGMTAFENLAAFEAASSTLSDGAEAGAFFSTFTPEVFTVLRPLNPDDRYDLSTFALEPGQVLEVATRDLSSYENFDAADYEAKRDAFLEALSQQPGWIAEMQWVSLFDPNLVVGMTVYESADAYQAIYSSEFVQSQATQDFAGNYPLVTGYASFDARGTTTDGASVPAAPSVAVVGDLFFPESIAARDDMIYVSASFSGEIQNID